MARDLATADAAAAVDADFLLALFEAGNAPASEDPVMQAARDVLALAFTVPPNSLTSSQREVIRDLIGLQHVPAVDRVAAASTVLRSFSPADIRAIAHNQAVRVLPGNGTEVETLRLYYGDDAAWDEEIYVCIQDHELTDDSRPEEGVNWETYFVKVTTRVKQVAALPAPADVTDRDLGKLHILRATHDGLPSALAHVAEVDDEKLGALTTGSDGSGRNGFINESGGARGHLAGYAGITRLDEILHTGGQHQLLLHVTADSVIPREDTPKLVYLREQGSTADWWETTVIDGADGTYASQGYSGARTLDAGKVYDVYIRSISQSSAIRIQTSAPATTNRYDFYPDSRTWAVFSETDDTDQHAVIIRELAGGPVIPDAPAGSGSNRRLLMGESGAYDLVSEVPEFMIPSGITRDSELTAAINALIDGAPGALDTLNELAAALNDDEAFNATVMTALAARLTADEGDARYLNEASNLGDLPSPSAARANLGLGAAATAAASRLIPDGGADGQVLAKTSAIDYATGWIDAAMGGAAQAAASTTTEEPKVFYTVLQDKADIQADSFGDPVADLEVMEIAADDISVNQGGFTVETTGGVSEIVIPLTGLYTVGVHLTIRSAASRTTPRGRVKMVRGADTTYGVIATGGYLRGSGTYGGDIAALDFTQPINLQAGDKLTVQVTNQSNDQLDLVGAESFVYLLKEEGPLSANDGFIVDVSANHHPPTATAETIRHIYKDYSHNPPKLWLGFQAYEHTTPPSITPDAQATAAAGYRGILYQAPAASASDDFFWSRSGHSWKYRAEGRFHNVSFTELKGEVVFFEDTDVFLNEVANFAQAAEIIQNDGYDADVRYFFVHSDVLYRAFGDDDYDAGVGTADLFDFIEVSELVQPRTAQEDTSLTAPASDSIWLSTVIDLPHGLWAHVKFGGITDHYFRFYVPDLDAKADGINGGTGVDAQRIEFVFGDHKLYLGKNASGGILLSSNEPTTFWPDSLTLRTN